MGSVSSVGDKRVFVLGGWWLLVLKLHRCQLRRASGACGEQRPLPAGAPACGSGSTHQGKIEKNDSSTDNLSYS